jgi:hypothetical protein
MYDNHANAAYSTVAVAPATPTAGTSLTVQTGDGAKFPIPPFNAPVWPAGVQPLTTNYEIVRVTAVAGDVFTIVRNTTTENNNSNNRTILVGDQIADAITWKMIHDAEYTPSVTSGRSPTVPANTAIYLTDYLEITSGDTVEIASGAAMEIG